MASTDLSLPLDLAEKLEARVASGAAADVVEVVREGLAALEAEDARRFQAIREKVARAMADPRPSIDIDEAFDSVEALLDALDRK
jgi:antitoxin ParD1/3/4